jgi:NAD(P)-dependent dehydrogenase (short-subunit alcohol dehydrogenase family)
MADAFFIVTGASTGIGRATALMAARAGYHVLAGVRREIDAESLRSEGVGIEPVLLDVCDSAAIAALRHRVESDARPLAVLVNNAGFTLSGMVELVPLERWREQFEVNLFGAIGLTQALLPALRKSRGRVINISSIGGRITAPSIGVYQASKYALESFSDALRMETRSQGVTVVIIEPGAIRTEIAIKAKRQGDADLAALPPEMEAIYGPLARGLADNMAATLNKHSIAPEQSARVILSAAQARRPRTPMPASPPR